jgi:hypothetical protein
MLEEIPNAAWAKELSVKQDVQSARAASAEAAARHAAWTRDAAAANDRIKKTANALDKRALAIRRSFQGDLARQIAAGNSWVSYDLDVLPKVFFGVGWI